MNTLAAPVYYPSPNVSRPASQLTEEEQVREFDIIQVMSHHAAMLVTMSYQAAILTDFFYVPLR